MRWYVASKVGNLEEVSDFNDQLTSLGQEVTLDWTKLDDTKIKPYADFPIENDLLSERMILAVKEADIFVLYHKGAGKGMYVEFGVALGREPAPQIYLVGEHGKSVFTMNRRVEYRETFDDVLKVEGLIK